MMNDIGSAIAVRPYVILEDSPLLSATGLSTYVFDTKVTFQQLLTWISNKKDIVATATVATTGLTAVFSLQLSSSAVRKHRNKDESELRKGLLNLGLRFCRASHSTEYDGSIYAGYAFKATTSGSNCDTAALEKTIKSAAKECANGLHTGKAVVGCCRFSYGRTWDRPSQSTAAPEKFAAKDVDC
ncbi:hypothetical protein AC579_5392 [Pseudocercospora musae]|uniref:Secreted protein CSS2 C-terminal domain-containing protein n=1 Tax=Pseudocercospora musae TaxID=113226 RepID=A0A139IE31_9PEZI|nr:hypothetical protein AC579_5392 [Pseudocercospora musae]